MKKPLLHKLVDIAKKDREDNIKNGMSEEVADDLYRRRLESAVDFNDMANDMKAKANTILNESLKQFAIGFIIVAIIIGTIYVINS